MRLTMILALFAAPPLYADIVAARNLPAGMIVGADDVVPADPDIPDQTAIDAATGRETRIAIYAGRPVRAGDLRAPTLVERNQNVRVTVRLGSLDIQAQGRAMDRGGAGDTVRVINSASRSTITAIVRPDGTLEAATEQRTSH